MNLRIPLAAAILIAAMANPITARAAEPSASITTLGGVGLNVTDSERSKKFYTDVLGMKVALVMPVGDKGSEIVMSMSGKMGHGESFIVLANIGPPPSAGKEGFGRVIINTTDPVGIAKRATTGGYKVRKMGVPEHEVYFISDPDGYQIEVYGATEAQLTQGKP
jgi:catechol 2,3-dioxygenase-like lactoylglutathione lyase family enzyme